MKNIKSSRNNSIDFFRLICAIMVVAIHTGPFKEINGDFEYFFSQIFPQVAVPFFFTISGYFYIKLLMSDKKIFFTYMKKLLIVYSLWSGIYFLIDFILLLQLGNINILSFIKECLLNYFFFGSNYQLWFFPAIFFAIILVTIFYKFKAIRFLAIASVVLYIIGCLGTSYYNVGINIPLISNIITSSQFLLIRRVVLMGLPFFMLGYFLNILEPVYSKFNNKKALILCGITICLLILENIIVIQFNLQKSIIITFMLYPLLAFVIIFLLNNPLKLQYDLGKKAKTCANFMYYAHPIFILLISFYFNKIFNLPVYPTLLFILTCTVSIIGGLIINLINNKWINKFII